MRAADCDSPAAISFFGVNPSNISADWSRSAWPAWENMSYEKLSPGCDTLA